MNPSPTPDQDPDNKSSLSLELYFDKWAEIHLKSENNYFPPDQTPFVFMWWPFIGVVALMGVCQVPWQIIALLCATFLAVCFFLHCGRTKSKVPNKLGLKPKGENPVGGSSNQD